MSNLHSTIEFNYSANALPEGIFSIMELDFKKICDKYEVYILSSQASPSKSIHIMLVSGPELTEMVGAFIEVSEATGRVLAELAIGVVVNPHKTMD